MNEPQERHWRRQAIRAWLRGVPDREILTRIPRSRSWLAKWKRRYRFSGWVGLRSDSRRPKQTTGYPPLVRRVVARVRQQLAHRRVGRLIGARAIRREIRQRRLLPPKWQPSQRTIHRMLVQQGLIKAAPVARAGWYPQPQPRATYHIQAMDWTARYLHGGSKVYAFHSLDLSTRDVHQTLSDNKRRATAEAHALDTWETLGLPHAVLIDNDADWCGSLKTARYFSHFMRLLLWVGIEPIFTPIAEPKANGSIERLNGLWQQQFWNLHDFQSLAEVRRHSPRFVQWYRTTYEPPPLGEQTPAQAQRTEGQRRLTPTERRQIPVKLPLTAGRLHFIRRVDAHGDITLLHETWHVHKRWAGQYMWATISLPEQCLRLYRAHPTQQRLQLCKVLGYRVTEPIVPLQPRFRRFRRRRKICTMSCHGRDLK